MSSIDHPAEEQHKWVNRSTRKRVVAWHKRAGIVKQKRAAEAEGIKDAIRKETEAGTAPDFSPETIDAFRDVEKPYWQRYIDAKDADTKWTKGVEQHLQANRTALMKGVDNCSVIKAKSSSSPLHSKAQEIIEALCAANPELIKVTPELHIHQDHSPLFGGADIQRGGKASFPDIIETNEAGLKHHLGEKGEAVFKVLISHELGHQVNRDNQASVVMQNSVRRPMTHKTELLASRIGAIIHGNVDEYAQVFPFFGGKDNPETHPSADQIKKDLEGWAQHLKTIGAVNETGKVTDVEKALAAFERSKFWATFENIASHIR